LVCKKSVSCWKFLQINAEKYLCKKSLLVLAITFEDQFQTLDSEYLSTHKYISNSLHTIWLRLLKALQFLFVIAGMYITDEALGADDRGVGME